MSANYMEALWSFLYGGPTDEEAAIRIQRAYRGHRRYELLWRLDVIHGRRPHGDRDSTDEEAEAEWWEEQRRVSKCGQEWVLISHAEC